MKKVTLFLLRTYNDIDHITPIIWKAIDYGWHVFIVFTDRDYSNDYRINFIRQHGATIVKSRAIDWYHNRFRRFLAPRIIQRFSDYFVAYLFGYILLKRYRIEVVASEWSGPFGRVKAEYFLRAAFRLKIPIYSLPHGYFLWTNSIFNEKLALYYKNNRRFPDFRDRNWFTKYVVQSNEHKMENVKYGMSPKKLVVLGSARFCNEWSEINHQLLFSRDDIDCSGDKFMVLFFLPHWDYNVHRIQCISLVTEISNKDYLRLTIKAHTRGSGALGEEERRKLAKKDNIIFAGDDEHSAVLIRRADVVINFGSSIGFEALRQGKPIINPIYLHGNGTFFDKSGVVYDATDEDLVLSAIDSYHIGLGEVAEQSRIDQFLLEWVDGGMKGNQVLGDYLEILSGTD